MRGKVNNLLKEMEEFCEVNGITDTEEFRMKAMKIGFDYLKYGVLNETSPQKNELEVRIVKDMECEKENSGLRSKMMDLEKRMEEKDKQIMELTRNTPKGAFTMRGTNLI